MRSLSLLSIAKLYSQTVDSSLVVQRVAVDTRLLQEGELFFALPGERTDGQRFLRQAAEKGACAAVVSTGYQGNSFGLPLLYVEDPLSALQQLAHVVLKKEKPQVLAITGSLGKTTTKDFVATLLAEKEPVAVTPSSYNGQIGLPLAILNNLNGERLLVLEMGMNQAGEIQKLVDIAPPDKALITCIDKVHTQFFADLSAIAYEKSALFSHPKTQLGLVNRRSPFYDTLLQAGSCIKKTYGVDCTEVDYSLTQKEGLVTLSLQGETLSVPWHLPADHTVENLLAACSLAYESGASLEHIRLGIPKLRMPANRLQFVEKDGIAFLNDSYNACMTSTCSALRCLEKVPCKGKRVAVLGEMLELGMFSASSHREVGRVARSCVDLLLCLGEGCAPLIEEWEKGGEKAVYCQDRKTAVSFLQDHLGRDDVVLLKGSKSWALWKILDEIQLKLKTTS